jgi:hypothetical protein
MLRNTILASVAIACAFLVVWVKGGPQPVHEIVIAIPAPQMPATTGRPA